MPYVTEELIRLIAPNSRYIPELVVHLNQLFEKYEINTPQRIAAFLSQAATETDGFVWLSEAAWCSEKKAREYCQRYEPGTGKGKKLGNTHLGDGYLYRGRGIFQLTGRYNYERYSKILGIDISGNPDVLSSNVHLACLTACEYWNQKNLNEWADKGSLRKITSTINGGHNKYEERKKYYNTLMFQLLPVKHYEIKVQDNPLQSLNVIINNSLKPHFNPGVYATLSEHCYTPKAQTPEGFKVLLNSKKYVYDPFRSSSFFAGYVKSVPPTSEYYQQFHAGFHATAYINVNEGVVVIANAGTDLKNKNGDLLCNLISDLHLGLRIIPAGQGYYDEFYKEVQRELRNQYPNIKFKVEHTGHSLGAARVQLAGVVYPSDVVVAFDGPGVRELLPKEIQANTFNNVINFIIDENAINGVNTRIGTTHQLSPCQSDRKKLANLGGLSWLEKCHEIKTFINAFDDNGEPIHPIREQKLQIEKIVPQQTYYGSTITPNLVNSVLRSSGVKEADLPNLTEEQIYERSWNNFGYYKFTYHYDTVTKNDTHTNVTSAVDLTHMISNATNGISGAYAEHIARLSGIDTKDIQHSLRSVTGQEIYDRNSIVLTYPQYSGSVNISTYLFSSQAMKAADNSNYFDEVNKPNVAFQRDDSQNNHFLYQNYKQKFVPIYSLNNKSAIINFQSNQTPEKMPTLKLMAITKVLIDATTNQQSQSNIPKISSYTHCTEPTSFLFNFDLIEKPHGYAGDSNIFFTYDTNHGLSFRDSPSNPDITITGSLFKIGKGGLILAPTIGAKIAFDTTPALLAGAGIGLGIGLGVLGAAYGVKKLVDHIQWSNLPADRKAEANLERAITKLNSARQKEFSWNNYSIVYWGTNWDKLITHRENYFKNALLEMRKTHIQDEAAVYDCDAFLFATEKKDPSLDPEKVRSSFNNHLTNQFNNFKDGLDKQDFTNAKSAASELLRWRPESFISHVAIGLILESENMVKATESFAHAITLAKDEKDKQMLNEQMFHHLWRKAEYNAGEGNNNVIHELRNFIIQRDSNSTIDVDNKEDFINTYLYNFKEKKFFDSHQDIIAGLEDVKKSAALPEKFQRTLAYSHYVLGAQALSKYQELSKISNKIDECDHWKQEAINQFQQSYSEFTIVEDKTFTDKTYLNLAILNGNNNDLQSKAVADLEDLVTLMDKKLKSNVSLTSNEIALVTDILFGLTKYCSDSGDTLGAINNLEMQKTFDKNVAFLNPTLANAYYAQANKLVNEAHQKLSAGDSNAYDYLNNKANEAWQNAVTHFEKLSPTELEELETNVLYNTARLRLGTIDTVPSIKSQLTSVLNKYDGLADLSLDQKRYALQSIYGLVTIAKQDKDFGEAINLLLRAEKKQLSANGCNDISREIAIANFELGKLLREQAIIAENSGLKNEAEKLYDKAKMAANDCRNRCIQIFTNDKQDNIAKLYFSYACITLNDKSSIEEVRTNLNNIIDNSDKQKESTPDNITKEQAHHTALACVALSQTELTLSDDKNRLKIAIVYREKAIIYDESLHDEIRILGDLYENDGQLDQACLKYQIYLEKNPKDEKTAISCARVLCKQNKFDEAKTRLSLTKQHLQNSVDLDKGIAAISQFEGSTLNCLMGELIGFGINQGVSYLINQHVMTIDKQDRTFCQNSASILSDLYGCTSGSLFKFMQERQYYSLLRNLGGEDQVPADWQHLKQSLASSLDPAFIMTKTIQGIGILRKNTTWFDEGHAKTVADIAEFSESGLSVYNQLAELLYDDGAGGTFLDSVDPYMSIGGILSRRISAYIESHKINRQQMFESPVAYLINDVAKGVGIASTVYAIARKYPESIIVNAIKTYAPYAVQTVASQVLIGLTVAYLAYKGYQRYQAKSLEAIKHNGLMLANEGKYEDAINKFENYLQYKSDDSEVKLALNKIRIVMSLKNQNYAKTIQDCNRHLQEGHSDDYIWFRAQAYFAQGDLQLAKVDYLKLDKNPYALAQLAYIFQATGDLHQAKIYCNTALNELQNQLISAEKDINIATEKKWHLGGLVEKTYSFVKNHRLFFNFIGINDGSFKFQLMLEESTKKRDHLIKEITDMKDKQLSGIEKAIVESWLNFCGDVAGNLVVTILQFIQYAVISYIQQPSRNGFVLSLPETSTAFLVHPLRQSQYISSAEKFMQKSSESSANKLISKSNTSSERRTHSNNVRNSQSAKRSGQLDHATSADKFMKKSKRVSDNKYLVDKRKFNSQQKKLDSNTKMSNEKIHYSQSQGLFAISARYVNTSSLFPPQISDLHSLSVYLLHQDKFDSLPLFRNIRWATDWGIDYVLNLYLKDTAHIIETSLSSVSSLFDVDPNKAAEALRNYGETIIGYYDHENIYHQNGFINESSSLVKPIVMIMNTASAVAQSSVHVSATGGKHWVVCIILPKHYQMSDANSSNDKERIIFIDSKYTRTRLPTNFKKMITEGWDKKMISETNDVDVAYSHRIPPIFTEPEFIELNVPQQADDDSCGLWAVYNTLMILMTGSTEFTNKFTQRSDEFAYRLQALFPYIACENHQVVVSDTTQCHMGTISRMKPGAMSPISVCS